MRLLVTIALIMLSNSSRLCMGFGSRSIRPISRMKTSMTLQDLAPHNVAPLLNSLSNSLTHNRWLWDDPFRLPTSFSGLHMDVKESKNQFELLFDIPGVDKKDITLSLDRDSITVAAERTTTSTTTPTDADGSEYKRVERFSGRVFRSLALPEGIDRERIHADYHNGVLHVKIPKTHLANAEHTKVINIKG